MDRRALRTTLWLLAVAAVLGAYLWWAPSVRHGPGQVAPHRPAQWPTQAAPFAHADVRILPRAEYRIEARVLGTERYWWDRVADLSPVDLALGWGPMSDEVVLDRLDVAQSGRFVFVQPLEKLPISQALFHLTFSNVHVIPGNAEVRSVLRWLRPGHVVRIDGWLVDVERDGRVIWDSSLERTDTGNGACEILYVTRIERVEAPEPRRVSYAAR